MTVNRDVEYFFEKNALYKEMFWYIYFLIYAHIVFFSNFTCFFSSDVATAIRRRLESFTIVPKNVLLRLKTMQS